MKFTTDAKWLKQKLSVCDDAHVAAGGTSLSELRAAVDRRTVTPATVGSAPTDLGRVVCFVRERKGLSRSQLADIAKLTEQEIIAIETVVNPDPSPRALVYLADALELSRSRLKELAGFVRSSAQTANDHRLLFAARSRSVDSVSDDEYEAIRALVDVLSEKKQG